MRGRADHPVLSAGFVGDGFASEKVPDETLGVGVQELFDARGRGRSQNEAGVMILPDALDDFRVVVGRSIRFLLTRQRNDYSGVVFAGRREFIRQLPGGNLQPRPFTPKVDAGGGFDHVGDIGTADARGDFKKIDAMVAVGLEEFGVSDAANQTEVSN